MDSGNWTVLLGRVLEYLRDNPAIFVSACSFFVALCSLCFSVYHSMAVRKHYALSVRPHLQFDVVLIPGGQMEPGLYLSNKGLGPAKIVEMVVGWNEETALNKNSFLALKAAERRACIPEGTFRLRGFDSNDAVDKQETESLVQAVVPKAQGKLPCFLGKLTVKIQYKSFYGKKPMPPLIWRPGNLTELEKSQGDDTGNPGQPLEEMGNEVMPA